MAGSGQQLRNWVFTMFNTRDGRPLEPCGDYGGELDGVADLRCAVWQMELCPTTSKLHLQGYCEFKRPKRMAAVKRILGDSVHLEGRKGTREQAIEYCRKESTRFAGPWEYGDLGGVSPGKRTDLHDVAERIIHGSASRRELVEDFGHLYVRYSRGLENLLSLRAKWEAPEWRDVKTVVYYGQAGTGKTRRAVEESGGDYFILHCAERVWFDGYDGESTLIIDDFYGWIRYGLLLHLLDGYRLRVEIKGGFTYANWTKVYITSNDAPEKWYEKGLTDALKRRLTEVHHFENPFE